MAQSETIQGILDDIAAIESHVLRGDTFEKVIEWLIGTAPEFTDQFDKVWLWKDWPGAGTRDLGIDLVAREPGGGLVAIQAKCWKPFETLTWRNMSTFYGDAMGRDEITSLMLVTSTDEISKNTVKKLHGSKKPVVIWRREDLLKLKVDSRKGLEVLGEEQPKGKTCGDYGGLRPTGEPCGLSAGWGTDHRGEGRCKSHDIHVLAKHEDLKKELLESIQTNPMLTLEAAALGVGRGLSWLSDQRRRDPEFDHQLMEAHAANDNTRVQMVEETFIQRLISGKANSSEYFFYLANRVPHRYRSISHVVHQGDEKRPLRVVAEETRREVLGDLEKMAQRLSTTEGARNRLADFPWEEVDSGGGNGTGNGVNGTGSG